MFGTIPKEPVNDEELYWAWKQANSSGDTKERALATEALNRGLRRYARSIVWSIVGYEIPELVGDIVTRAFLNESKFDGRSKFTTWFYSLAVHATYNYLRDQRRRRECSLDVSSVENTFVSTSPPARALSDEVSVPQLLATLSETDRRLVVGKMEGLTSESLAKTLGLTKEAVKSRWRRLKKRLQKLVVDAQRSNSAETS